MASRRDRKIAIEETIDKVKQRLQGWKMKTLSQAGKTTLITSVASSFPYYQASSLLFPRQVCSKLYVVNRNFWWGFKDENKLGCCLKSWDSICTPKSVGGLGIKKTEDMNKALVVKMTWEIASNANKLWVQILKINT